MRTLIITLALLLCGCTAPLESKSVEPSNEVIITDWRANSCTQHLLHNDQCRTRKYPNYEVREYQMPCPDGRLGCAVYHFRTEVIKVK